MKSTHKIEIYTVFSALYTWFLMILHILELLSKYEKIKWAGKMPLRQVTGKLNRPSIARDRIYVLFIISFLLMLHDDVSNAPVWLHHRGHRQVTGKLTKPWFYWDYPSWCTLLASYRQVKLSPTRDVFHISWRSLLVKRPNEVLSNCFLDNTRNHPGWSSLQAKALTQRAICQIIALYISDAGM